MLDVLALLLVSDCLVIVEANLCRYSGLLDFEKKLLATELTVYLRTAELLGHKSVLGISVQVVEGWLFAPEWTSFIGFLGCFNARLAESIFTL